MKKHALVCGLCKALVERYEGVCDAMKKNALGRGMCKALVGRYENVCDRQYLRKALRAVVVEPRAEPWFEACLVGLQFICHRR